MPSDQEAQTPVFFELPKSPIKGIPLMHDGEKLALGLVEIGCHYSRKPGQLKNKRELFMRYWAENYRKPHQIPWTAHFYRMICHYRPWVDPDVSGSKYAPDVVVHYKTLDEKMLRGFTPEQREGIAGTIEERMRSRVHRMLVECDVERLQHMLVHDLSNRHGDCRGKMAEIMAQKDVQRALPQGMSLYTNEYVRYFSKKFRNGTEVDGITICYGEAPYLQLVENLRGFSHLVVHDRWHKN